MSLGARATKGGAKGKDKHAQDKAKGVDKPPAKEKVKPQATTEQLRMAHMIDRKSEDASDVRRMVLELMEMTCRTEEEVCSALHDSDNDMVAACNLLLEESQRIQGEWQTSEKKKKKPPSAAGNGEPEPPREREPRERSGAPRSRRGEAESGRGRGGGAARGRGATRGRARGARRPPPGRARPARQGPDDAHDPGNNIADSFPNAEDWDNEEWSGSLSDTKVFTPSTSGALGEEMPPATNATEECWDTGAANGAEHIPSYSYSRLPEPRPPAPALSAVPLPPAPASPAPAAPPADPAPPRHQPMGMSGSLSAAQSQYLSQLTQQSQRHDNSVYSSNYGVYGSSDITNQRKPQRARVPPPSKIPSSAVEMPAVGGEGALFLDVQFGALEPDALAEPATLPAPASTPAQPSASAHAHAQPAHSAPPAQPMQPAKPSSAQAGCAAEPTSASAPAPAPAPHDAVADAPAGYANTNTNTMLPESLEPTPTPASEPAPQPNSLEKQLTAAMKQLAVSAGDAPAAAPPLHRHKTVGQQNVYPAHHAVSHHPPVYGANVYAPQQVNSTNASLTASGMTAPAYGANATLTQYQPMINSYQTSSSAGVYAGSALYTYQPSPQAKLPTKDTPQYDNSVASSNSLTSTSTTQSSTAKVATTTVNASANAGAVAANAGVSGAGAGAGAGYGTALYGGVAGAPGAYAHYDEAQLITRTLPHHMGGYYEVGYGVGGAREGTFGLGPSDRFTRTDAASPQQVGQVPAALPPGYAYFYQPPPTTYQYGVYPTYGGGSNVGGVGSVAGGVAGAGKVSSYSQQQPPYDQDSYKTGGGYSGSGKAAAAGAPPELASAMYAKPHVALNKVNSYDKATFHSGTPPPFGAGSHLYIPAPHTTQHHHPHHHQPHQMDVRVNSSHNRRDSGAARAAAAKPAASKPSYSQSYWAPN